MDDELDVAGDFIAKTTQCSQCGREIGFKANKPHDVKYITDGVYKLLPSLHFETCPVRIRQRMEANCVWCQFEKKAPVAQIRRLIGYETCDRHSDKTEEFQYRGKTYTRTIDSLKTILHDKDVEKRRRIRKSQKPENMAAIEVFLIGNGAE
jgi:hypothetical protein